MRFSAEGDSGPGGGRPIRGRAVLATISGVLLGLLAICAPVHAQEIPGTQATELAGDSPGALPRAEWPLIDRDPIGSIFEPAPGTRQPIHDLFPPPDLAELSTPQQTPPEPEHTGFKALLVETGRDYKAFPRRTSTWVILAIGGGAAAIAHPYDKRVTESFAGSDAAGKFFVAGKYIGSDYVQFGTAIGLYVVGRYMLPHEGGSKTNKVSHLGFDMLRALIVSQSLTQGIKVAVQRDRPTGECCSFPSGHASAAFATASVIERHLGFRGAVPTFAIASYVAMSRLHDNRHFLSDVLFGGALGMSSGWTVVGRHGRSSYAVVPAPIPGGMMVRVMYDPSRELH